jgi:hypothetical protein
VLRPFRDRGVDRVERARDVFDELRPRAEDEEDRAPAELREPDALRELEVARPREAVFVLLAPFLELDLERLLVLRRRLVLAFACAIYSSVSAKSEPGLRSGYPQGPSWVIWAYPTKPAGNSG